MSRGLPRPLGFGHTTVTYKTEKVLIPSVTCTVISFVSFALHICYFSCNQTNTTLLEPSPKCHYCESLNWDQIENLFIHAIQTQFYKSDFDLIYRWENRPGKRLNILLSSSSKPGKRLALGHTSVDFRLSSLGSLMACVIQEGLAPNISPSRDVQNMLQGYFLGESCSQRHGLQPCLHAVRVDSRGLFREQELKVPEGRQGSHAGQGGRLSAPASCCHDNSFQGRGLSLGALRKPRVGLWFRDPCPLVRPHLCGRYRVPPPLPTEPLSSTDSMEVWFAFAGPICLEMDLKNSALSSPEVPPAATTSSFFPNDTHVSTWISRLSAWNCSRPVQPGAPRPASPTLAPGEIARWEMQWQQPLSNASGLILTEPWHTYTRTHTHAIQMSREMRKGHTYTHAHTPTDAKRKKEGTLRTKVGGYLRFLGDTQGEGRQVQTWTEGCSSGLLAGQGLGWHWLEGCGGWVPSTLLRAFVSSSFSLKGGLRGCGRTMNKVPSRSRMLWVHTVHQSGVRDPLIFQPFQTGGYCLSKNPDELRAQSSSLLSPSILSLTHSWPLGLSKGSKSTLVWSLVDRGRDRGRVGYVICGTQCKMTIQVPLFKK